MDFEKAIHLNAHSTWPNARITGFRFYLSQSWWRRIQNECLKKKYHSETEIVQILTLMYGLKMQDEDNCFVEDVMAILPNDGKLRRFLDCLPENCFGNDSTFPPNIWAEVSSCIS